MSSAKKKGGKASRRKAAPKAKMARKVKSMPKPKPKPRKPAPSSILPHLPVFREDGVRICNGSFDTTRSEATFMSHQGPRVSRKAYLDEVEIDGVEVKVIRLGTKPD